MNARRIGLTIALLAALVGPPVGAWAWELTTIGAGNMCSVTLDSAGNPGIAYRRISGSNHLMYAHRAGDLWDLTDAGGGGTWADIAYDADDHPWMSHSELSARETHWTGTAWGMTQLIGEYSGSTSAIVMDASGTPTIFFDRQYGPLWSARWNGTGWNLAAVDTTQYTASYGVDAALDGDGNLGVVSVTNTGEVRYYTQTGGLWGYVLVGTGGRDPSLAYDQAGNAHISYYNASSGYWYANNGGGVWESTLVERASWAGPNAIAINEFGNPCVAFREEWYAGADLRFAEWTGSAWSYETIGSVGTVESVSLAIDAQGNTHLTYSDSQANEVKYAYREGQGAPPAATPELSTWALLACTGLFGVGMMRRRRDV